MQYLFDKLPQPLLIKISRLTWSAWLYDSMLNLIIENEKCLICRKSKKHRPHCIIIIDENKFLNLFVREKKLWCKMNSAYSSPDTMQAWSHYLPIRHVNYSTDVCVDTLKNFNLHFNQEKRIIECIKPP